MKKLLLLIAMLLSSMSFAQDCKFLSKLYEPVDLQGAKNIALALVDKTVTNKYLNYQHKTYKDRGLFVIMFSTQCFEQEQIDAGEHVDNCFGIYFTVSGNQYTFKKIVSNYDDIYPVWRAYFSTKEKDYKPHGVLVGGTNIRFSLNPNRNYWVIRIMHIGFRQFL
jgi:hypothetical protein